MSDDQSTSPDDPQIAQDIADAMWNFWTPDVPLPFHVEEPDVNAPQIGTGQQPPHADRYEQQVFVIAGVPQFDRPNFWAKPFDTCAESCILFYERWATLLTYKVPPDYLLRLDGICFEPDSAFAPGEVFEVQILRSGVEMTRFEEVVIDPGAADPGNRTLFSSSLRLLPLYVMCDRNDTLTINVRLRGTYPFVKTNLDTACMQMKVCPVGWLGSLMDNRDGAPRPSDLGGAVFDRPAHEGGELRHLQKRTVASLVAWWNTVARRRWSRR